MNKRDKNITPGSLFIKDNEEWEKKVNLNDEKRMVESGVFSWFMTITCGCTVSILNGDFHTFVKCFMVSTKQIDLSSIQSMKHGGGSVMVWAHFPESETMTETMNSELYQRIRKKKCQEMKQALQKLLVGLVPE